MEFMEELIYRAHENKDCALDDAEIYHSSINKADRVFYYDSRRAGGGKTYDTVTATCHRAMSGQKCLIVQPTTKLIDETYDDICERFPLVNVYKLHSDDRQEGKVISRITNFFKACNIGGMILILTHNALLNLKYVHRKQMWHLYVDESISAFECYSEQLPNENRIVTDHVAVDMAASKYGILRVTNRTELEIVAQNKAKDVVHKTLQTLAGRLLSDHYDSYVDIARYKALIQSKSKDGKLSVFSILRTSLVTDFASVTITAARFQESMMYHLWEREGIKWKVSRELARDDVSQVHPHNNTIDIYYGYERDYSKYTRNGLGNMGSGPIITATEMLMGDKEFIRVENNDVKHVSELNKLPNSNLISGISHGLNCYKKVDHAVVIAAYNPPSEACRFLSELCDIDSKKLYTAITNHNVYQSICRTSIRSGDSTRQKIWVVASKGTANWLNGVFPGSRIHSLGLMQPETKATGRPRINANDSERKRKSKQLSKAELALGSGFARHLDAKMLDEVVYLRNGDESTISDISRFVSRFKACYFDNYESNEPYAICMTSHEIVSYLRSHIKNVYAAKNEIPCVSGAMFRVSKSDKSSRGNENVEFVRGMWLDIEKGNMTPEDLSDSFPQLHIVAYNTFNHTDERPRYRAYIPTSRAMTDVEYRTIYAEIVYVLESRGYEGRKIPNDRPRRGINSRHHGIDHRPAPCSVFTLPCKPNDGSKGFFKEYKDSSRAPLDVDAWLSNPVSPQWEPDFDPPNYEPLGGDQGTITPEQQAGIEAAEAEWYRTGVMPGEGDGGILALYHALCRLRLNPQTIGERLYHAARSANSPTNRKMQVDRLMTQLLRRYRSTIH